MVTITYDALNDLTHAVGEEIEKTTGLSKDEMLDLFALNYALTSYLERYGVQYEDELPFEGLVPVDANDLEALLDYAQPDEEKDIEREPENDSPGHVVYVIRRLRTALDEAQI